MFVACGPVKPRFTFRAWADQGWCEHGQREIYFVIESNTRRRRCVRLGSWLWALTSFCGMGGAMLCDSISNLTSRQQ